LGGHSLREFNTELANNMTQARQVADCLPNNSCQNPNDIFFPHRLVPVAAQMAIANLNSLTVPTLDALHQNALSYLHRIKRPEFLAGASRREFLRELVGELDFRQQPQEEAVSNE